MRLLLEVGFLERGGWGKVEERRKYGRGGGAAKRLQKDKKNKSGMTG